jgi:hypothetical protein
MATGRRKRNKPRESSQPKSTGVHMQKVAIVILSDTSPADGLGRVVNGLMAAKEFKEAKDDVQVIFTGAGTKWLPELAKPEHMLHGVYQELQDSIAGACGFCAGAFGVSDAARQAGVGLLEEYGTNMSFRRLVRDGYQVIAF